jgi:hypothetical protein
MPICHNYKCEKTLKLLRACIYFPIHMVVFNVIILRGFKSVANYRKDFSRPSHEMVERPDRLVLSKGVLRFFNSSFASSRSFDFHEIDLNDSLFLTFLIGIP